AFHGYCPYHVVRPVRGTSCGATLRSVDAAALLRGLSAQQRTGPAPVALGAEELHPLYLVLFFHVIPNPGQGRGVVSQIALVNDTIVRGGGCIHTSASAIWISHSANNIVSHNDVSDFFWSGVSVGKSFAGSETTPAEIQAKLAKIQAKDNVIEFNHIHHLGWGVLSDMGGTYSQYTKGTVVRNNVIH